MTEVTLCDLQHEIIKGNAVSTLFVVILKSGALNYHVRIMTSLML